MTVAEIRAEVAARLDVEAGDLFFSADDIADAVDDGNRELADASEYLEERADYSRTTSTYYETLGVTLTIKAIRNPVTNRYLDMVSQDDLDKKYSRDWELVTGEPNFFFMLGLFMFGVFPKSPTATGVLEVYQASDPGTFVLPSQTPAFPAERHFGIVEYAMYTLLRDAGEVKKALIHWDAYLVHEAKLVEWVRGRMRAHWGVIGG